MDGRVGRPEKEARDGSPARRLAPWRVAPRIALSVGLAAFDAHEANADPQVVVPQGLPAQVRPTYPEPGLPLYNFQGGQYSVGTTSGGGTGSGGGSTTTTGIGGWSGTGMNLSGTAYDAMMSTAWGDQASEAATTMGVNPAALAATCYAESRCQNEGAPAGGTASGAFQMIDSTYGADIAAAQEYAPQIADTIVSGMAGKMDPGTEAYAASYELRSDALLLQSAGIENPSVLAVRAVYQFGGNVGPAVADAPDSANLNDIVHLNQASLAANGLTSQSTVGEWRQMVVETIGADAAAQSVMTQ